MAGDQVLRASFLQEDIAGLAGGRKMKDWDKEDQIEGGAGDSEEISEGSDDSASDGSDDDMGGDGSSSGGDDDGAEDEDGDEAW